jgi:hypothetical protein
MAKLWRLMRTRYAAIPASTNTSVLPVRESDARF